MRRACVILALAACLILAAPAVRSLASPTPDVQKMQPAVAANVAVAASSDPHHRDSSAAAPASLPNTGAALNASPWSLVGVLALLMLGLGFMLHRMARQI